MRKGCCSDCILKWVGNNTGCENIIKNLQNQHSFFLVNMKARQLHLPHMCLANCCSGRRASLSGVWELIEARVGIPALCWVEQGVSMLLKAVPFKLLLSLYWSICPSLWGYVDPLIWLHVPGQVLQNQDLV